MASEFQDRYPRQVSVTEESDGTIVLRARSTSRLDLSPLPGERVIQLHAPTNQLPIRPITLTGCREDHHVLVTLPLPVTVAEAETLGKITFRVRQNNRAEPSFVGCATELRAEEGPLQLDDSRTSTLILAGGEVKGSLDGAKHIVAEGTARLPEAVPCLEVSPAGAKVLVDRQTTVEVLKLDRGTMVVEPASTNARRLTLNKIHSDGGTLDVREKQTVTVSEVEGGLTVEGRGILRVPRNQTVSDVTVNDRVQLQLEPGATLLRFGGRLLALECSHASVVAAPGASYEYLGLASRERRGSVPEQLLGATLRGVRIDDTAAGRRQLRELDAVAAIEPDIERLRIHRYGIHWNGRRFARPKDQPDPRTVDDAAFFAQELAGLVSAKCGSGSIRTKSAWAAYRGRHLTARSPWERRALDLFRLVGYGQRVGPALAMWALFALVLAVPMLAAVGGAPLGDAIASWTTVKSWSEQALRLLLAPISLLRLAGDPALRDTSELRGLAVVAIQTLAAVPFAFAVVATSRFLRADWPSLGGTDGSG